MIHHWHRVLTKGAYLVLLLAVLCTASRSADAQRTPLVVVPGILGSQLCDGTTVIWGDRGSLQDFARLDTLSDQGRRLKPCGLLKKIQLLGSFWATDGYDVLLAQLDALGFRGGADLILFDYDWRQSNFETAELLKRRLRESTVFQTGQFDVIAHSMGGLVTRILLNDPEFAPRVRRVIYLATPFHGSSNTLGILTDGWGSFLNLVAGGMDTIRHTALSFTSLYELMPRHDGCCRLGSPEAPASAIKLPTLLDAELWRRHDWLPDAYKTGPRSAFFDQAIASGQRIKSALAVPLANPIEQIRVVGTGIDTRLHLYVNPADTGWRRWRFSSDKGDGTVPIWSASQGSVTGASPAFSPHASIFEDRWVAQRIAWLLGNVAPPELATLEASVMTVGGGAKFINRVHAGVVPEVGPPGSAATLNVIVLAAERPNRGTIAPSFSLNSQSSLLTETTEDVDLTSNTLTFTAKFARPTEPGIYRIDIRFGPESRDSAYIVVQ